MRKHILRPGPLLLLYIFFSISLGAFAQSPVVELVPPDVEQLLREDASSIGVRFAAPIATDLRSNEVGQVTATGYELELTAAGALGLGVFLDQVNLPAGGQLFLENDRGARGPYTSDDLTETGRLFTDFLPGAAVRLRYVGPPPAGKEPLFRVWRVDYAYRKDRFEPKSLNFGFGTSNDCHENANCPAAAEWEQEKKASCRIIVVVEEGTGYCTGTLLNNTAEDARALLLTGFHCQDGYTPLYDLWRFDFGYLAPDCANPATEPAFTTLTGAIQRAGRRDNDFLLLEITDEDLDPTALHFSGWDRSAEWAEPGAVLLHHPRGDIQKFSATTNPVVVFGNPINWNNNVTTPANHHWDLDFTTGTFEVGSSGAALYDSEHRIRGQLHGGNPNCPGTTQAWCGRLNLAWEGGGTPASRLRDWLDPLGTGAETLNALGAGAAVAGGSVVKNGDPLPGVQLIWTTTTRTDTTYSAADGTFARPALAAGTSVTLRAERPDAGNNGVSTLDIALARKHLLQLQLLEDPLQIVSADANGNGSVSSLDFIFIQRVVLTIEDGFAPQTEWIFQPVDEATQPLPQQIGNEWTFTVPSGSDWRINLRGSKRGDVNYTATTTP
jgi:hypothetical protein